MPELNLTAAAEQITDFRGRIAQALSTARKGQLLRSGLQVIPMPPEDTGQEVQTQKSLVGNGV